MLHNGKVRKKVKSFQTDIGANNLSQREVRPNPTSNHPLLVTSLTFTPAPLSGSDELLLAGGLN